MGLGTGSDLKIAIIGSREGFDKEFVFKKLDEIDQEHIDDEYSHYMQLVTGGARGIDQYAMEWYGQVPGHYYQKPIIIRPVDPSIKTHYLYRNIEIISMSKKIYAFWNGTSRGTKFVIDYAKSRGKEVHVITPEDLLKEE